MLFFGPSFAVQSLNSLLVILLSFWFIWLMSEFGTVSKRYYVAGFFTPFLFSMLIVAFLAHPQSAIVLADHIHFMCFFSIAQFYCLIRKRTNLFLIFALLAFLTKYEALLFTFLGLWFYKSIFETKKGEVATLLTKYLILISPYVIVMFLIGLFRGDLGGYAEAFFVERFMRLDYFGILPSLFSREGTSGWASFSVQSTIEFLKYFMLGSVCLGLVIFIPQKDKMSRFFGQIAVVYFILVMISMEKRIHYISPLVFMSVIIALRMFICGRLKDENFLKTPGSSQGVG
jgi:hypothetical protein